MKKSFLICWLAFVLLLGFFWIYFPTLTRYRDLKFEKEQLGRELRDLDFKVEDLREERDLLESDKEYIEKVIRQELGLVKPGETIYKFVEEELILEEPPKEEEENEKEETPAGLAEEITKQTPETPTAPEEPEIESGQAEDIVWIPAEDDAVPAAEIVESKPPVRQEAAAPLKAAEPEVVQAVTHIDLVSPAPPRKVVPAPVPSKNTLLQPAPAPRAVQVTPKPVLQRRFPPAEDDSDEGESLWGRIARKVSDTVSTIQEEWLPEEDTHVFPPLPSQRRAAEQQKAPIQNLPNRISQPLPVSQTEQPIPFSTTTVYPRQETR